MNFTFLGTGAGIPAKERNVSAIAVSFPEYKGHTWLFDCGEATQHQILSSPIKLSKINRIFISHLHGDHIYGLPGLLGSRSFQGGTETLNIIGPKGIKAFIDVSLKVSSTHIKYPLHITEIEESSHIVDTEHFSIQIEPLEHGITSFGFRVVEKDQPGELLVDKLTEKGIKPGPIYKAIKTEKEVVLPSGEILKTSNFIGPNKKGRTFALLGDTRYCSTAKSLSENVDLLIHEATFEEKLSNLAHDYYHSTTFQAAQIAKAAKVAALILTHISSRYLKTDHERLLGEAKKLFLNTYLATDGWTYHLNRQPRSY
ncbi:ribonuclease Z [Terrilactibacillus sp. BCM23-1]|uniref:Ribonuclease Z n=1 Tax=Terrilactibacillus tamarindi TaxID=2599694 RepID=A0A6N8CV48_9BACI|nr:ribonuclease Z [Terrilactibacillus tamarindi]MTT33307.1 ribonuclease Z [Terrilactibacillus tamarindi]